MRPMNQRSRKRGLNTLRGFWFHRSKGAFAWEGDQLWGDMAPIGCEFGSPDYDRLMDQDVQRIKAALNSLVEDGQESVSKGSGYPEVEFRNDAINIQTALRDLGHEVGLPTAEAIWTLYSKSLFAEWMSGAETVASARRTLLMHCWRTSSSMDGGAAGSASINPHP